MKPSGIKKQNQKTVTKLQLHNWLTVTISLGLTFLIQNMEVIFSNLLNVAIA